MLIIQKETIYPPYLEMSLEFWRHGLKTMSVEDLKNGSQKERQIFCPIFVLFFLHFLLLQLQT